MTCPVCGKPQPCVHGWKNSSVVTDPQTADRAVEAAASVSAVSGPGAGKMAGGPSKTAADAAWRQEVVSRVQQHRARRRKSGDANALELDFTTEEPYSFEASQQGYPLSPPPARFAEIMVKPDAPKIIRFPRPTITQPPAIEEVSLDELAVPTPETPRILDAPEMENGYLESDFVVETEDVPQAPAARPAEQMQLLPSFDDIHLEPDANRLTAELDVIPQAAPLSQRVVAGMVDAAIVLIASCIFALTFLELAEEAPQSRLNIACALAVGAVFWLVFQYLFLTYGRRTPGMKLAQLELCTFEGKRAPLSARRSRALASGLSGFAIGLGYLWTYIDEDRLGWHDRISQTYLKASLNSQPSAFSQIETDIHR